MTEILSQGFFRAVGLAALFSFVVATILVGGCGEAVDKSAPGFDVEQLVINTSRGNVTFDIEVARSDSEKSRGLMFRRQLAQGHGMLFVYERSDIVTMWMRNTYIPLDMIFIDQHGVVRHIARQTQPLSDAHISSGEPVTAVLEIGGGEAARLGVEIGDMVRHPHFAGAGSAP